MFKGSVTCHGDKVKNANCPKDQYMVVKFAVYRGLLAPKKCGSSDDYSCEVDVTCLVKKQCDGLHECSIMVDDKLFSSNKCPGLSNYLYFEYQCIDSVKPFKGPCGMYIDRYGGLIKLFLNVFQPHGRTQDIHPLSTRRNHYFL